jgi:Phage-related minor tail protein
VGANVVEIVVTATDDTEDGFAAAKAQADGAADSMDAYADSADDAAAAAGRDADAQKDLAGAQGDAADSAKDAAGAADDEAGAQDRQAAAAGRAADASKDAADAQGESAAAARDSADAQDDAAAKTDEGAAAAAGASGKLKDLALGAGAAAAGAIYLGMKFQESSSQLVTGAGESAKSLGMIEQGMLRVSTATGTSSKDVEAGMYMIASAGYHGAAGLRVLQAAAEGAKVGNAQLGDVANVVTSALNAYHLPASAAVAVTDQLVATVGAGKMQMQDLATSMANVLPIAASAHISLAQVGGALATMTAQGMTARRASMDLANMIRSLINPTSEASGEMKSLGLDANQVASQVGSKGLTGTLSTLTEAILRNTHGGSVLAATFRGMSPAAQELAERIIQGKISTEGLTSAVDALNPKQAALVTQFSQTATSATGLKQTFDAAMAKMVGGATGLNVALLLGGKHMSTFESNTGAVGKAAEHAGSQVRGFGVISGDAAFKLDQAKEAVLNTATAMGMALLPALTKILGPVASFLSWVSRSKIAIDALAAVIVGALAGYAAVKAVSAVNTLKGALSDAGKMAGWLAEKLGLAGGASDEEAASAASDSEVLAAAYGSEAEAAEGAEVAQEGLNASLLANPITLIIAAVALLVVAFVELWRHCAAFRDFWKDAWHDILTVVDAAVSWIKSHWELLLGILTGPIGAAVIFIVSHWHDIEKAAEDLWHFLAQVFHAVVSAVKDAWDDVVAGTKVAWGLIMSVVRDEVRGVEVILSWFSRLGALFRGWWDDGLAAVRVVAGDLVSFVRGIPGRILAALGDLGHLLWNAGRAVISGLISGIKSMIGDVGSAIGSIAGEITSHLPFSPAKKGPLSGSGDPRLAGLRIARYLGQGMTEGLPDVQAAAARLAGAAGAGGRMVPGAYAGAGAGGAELRLLLEVTGGGSAFEQFMVQAIRNWVRIRGGNVQAVLGH